MPAVPVVAAVVLVGEGAVAVVGPEAGAGVAALAGAVEVVEVVVGAEAALAAVAVVAVGIVDEAADVVVEVAERLAQTAEPAVTQAEPPVELVEVVGASDAFVAFATSDVAFVCFGGWDAPFLFPPFQVSMYFPWTLLGLVIASLC